MLFQTATRIVTPEARRTIHNMHTVGLLKEDLTEHLSSVMPRKTPAMIPQAVSIPMKKRPRATSGDYCILGTDSDAYHCLDTNPQSPTEPYENPKMSGKQLRYGGMPPIAKEEFGTEWEGIGGVEIEK